MNKTLSLALLIVGVVLIFYGVQASESIGSSFSRIFRGSPTNQTVWFLAGGLLLAGVGLSGIIRRSRSN